MESLRPKTLVWYDVIDDEIGSNIFLDGYFYSLEMDAIPWNYILLGEL